LVAIFPGKGENPVDDERKCASALATLIKQESTQCSWQDDEGELKSSIRLTAGGLTESSPGSGECEPVSILLVSFNLNTEKQFYAYCHDISRFIQSRKGSR
jgi:hypothetical protein